MGWQDRDYGPRINYGDTPFSNPILKVIFGSVPIGTWFGIQVRVHATLLWFLAFQLFRAGSIGWQNVLASSTLIFTIVLLHEFGHCIGARLVGGHADHILLWPLGGLAFNTTERTPWARFVTVACGPLVNVILAAILAPIIILGFHVLPPFNPLYMFSDSVFSNYWANNPEALQLVWASPLAKWLIWAFSVNLMLIAFNLVPMYPFDGGRLAQVAMWKPLGYHRSMNIACIVGMICAIPMALWGLTQGAFITIGIAIFGFYDCYQERRMLRFTAAEENSDSIYDLSAAWDHPDRRTGRKKTNKRWAKAARKKAQAEQAEQAEIDAILAKVKEKGLHSLTWWEKRALKRATERQRQRDLAERL